MSTSYLLMLTAFYVDNGPRQPVWWRLPPWALLVMPTLVGGPLLVRAWRQLGERHRPGA